MTLPFYQPSNYVAIGAAILALGQTAHDDPAYLASTGQLAYTGTKMWEIPSQRQVMAAGGTPFLAVRFGKNAGYGLGGVLQSADMAAQGPSGSEPYWDWEVFSLHPYDETDPNYGDAAQDMVLLQRAFNSIANHTLNGTCQSSYVADMTPAYVELQDGTPYTAAYLVIRTGEFLLEE